ncbi:MAG: hypothetical protein ACLPKB_06730, partial [Xanthobacteraceae bacterium]
MESSSILEQFGALPTLQQVNDILVRRAVEEQQLGNDAEIQQLKQQCSTLIGFTQYRMPRYRPSKVHHFICEHLERLTDRRCTRLMLRLPPRHGKSEVASKSYPAFALGRHPERDFIAASASVPLAQDFGRQVRNIVASEQYQAVFNTRLAEDSKAAGKWNTSEGGCWYSVGVGGAVLGRGAHDAMIDDPYGSMEDARSDVIRKKVRDWYTGTLYNRLEPDGTICIIGHRMHEDDLQGWLEEKMRSNDSDADQWEIVELPAFAHENDPMGRMVGAPLWPEHFDKVSLDRIRANTSARDWSALYDQNPVPDEGEMFSPDRIGMRGHTSDVIIWCRGWDLAGT